MPSTSRWLVGSSSTTRSSSPSSARGQRDPPFLTAGQPVDDAVEVVHAQPVEHVADLGIGGPFVLGSVVAEDDVAHPRTGRQVVALRQVRHPQAAHPAHPPAVGCPGAGEDVEQRGLAAAVEPDDADAVARIHAERHPVQQHARGIAGDVRGDRLEVDEVGHQARTGGHDGRAALGSLDDARARHRSVRHPDGAAHPQPGQLRRHVQSGLGAGAQERAGGPRARR